MAASAYSAPARDNSIAQINITPLVDVMLVLLVIFMIAAPAVTGTLPMRLPANGAPDVPPPRLTLRVDASGAFSLDGRALSPELLGGALRDAALRAPTTIVQIAASKDADYQAFATALSTARASGLENVTLAQ